HHREERHAGDGERRYEDPEQPPDLDAVDGGGPGEARQGDRDDEERDDRQPVEEPLDRHAAEGGRDRARLHARERERTGELAEAHRGDVVGHEADGRRREPGVERRVGQHRLEQRLPAPGADEEHRRCGEDSGEEPERLREADLTQHLAEVDAAEREREQRHADRDAQQRLPAEGATPSGTAHRRPSRIRSNSSSTVSRAVASSPARRSSAGRSSSARFSAASPRYSRSSIGTTSPSLCCPAWAPNGTFAWSGTVLSPGTVPVDSAGAPGWPGPSLVTRRRTSATRPSTGPSRSSASSNCSAA